MPKWTARWFRVLALTLAVLALSWAMAAGAVEPLCGTDIDGDGQASTDTDGQLLLRHLFGFAGEQLITGAVGAGCTRCSAAAIATRLETDACRVLFDIDGDGLRGALTDGLLLWRLLAGLTGQALTADALGAGAVRTDPESLSGWLSTGILPPGEALNDTGIDWCANETQNFLACPVAGYPGQDAQDGRDKTHDDNSDGHAGFSFTTSGSEPFFCLQE